MQENFDFDILSPTMTGKEIQRPGDSYPGAVSRRGFIEGVTQIAKLAAMANQQIVTNPRFFETMSELLVPAPVGPIKIVKPAAVATAPSSLSDISERLAHAYRARTDFLEVLGNPRFYSTFMNQVPRVVGMMAEFGITSEGVIEGLTQAKTALRNPELKGLLQEQIAEIHVLKGNIPEGLSAAPSTPGVIQVGHLRTAIDRCAKTGEDPALYIQQALDTILTTPLKQDRDHRFVELELLSYHVQNPEDAIRILKIAEGLLDSVEGRDLTGSCQRLATAYAHCGHFEEALSFVRKLNNEVPGEDNRFADITRDLILDDLKGSIIHYKKFDEAMQFSDKPEFTAWVLAQKALYTAQQGLTPTASINEAMELANQFTGNIADMNRIKVHLSVARALAANLEGAVAQELVSSSWNTLTANEKRFSPRLALDIIKTAELIGMDAETYYKYYFDFVEKQKPEPKAQTERGDDMYFPTGDISYLSEGIQTLLANGHLDWARKLLETFPILEDYDFDLVLRAELANAEAKKGLSADELETLSSETAELLRQRGDPFITEALEFFQK